MDQAEKLAQARKALLAKRLKGKKSAAKKPVEQIPHLSHSNPVPLSLGQQRFWVTHQLDQSKASHNMYEGWRVSGHLDYDALQWAFGSLVDRHPVLRTKIKVVNGTPMQASHPTAFFRFNRVVDHELDRVNGQIAAEINRPFDLESDPLIRLTVYQLTDDETDHILLLTIHHIISDEYSNGVIWEELAQQYAIAIGEADEPEPVNQNNKPLHFRDYAEWQAGWLAKDNGQKQLDYWRKELDGEITNLQLPLDKNRPAAPSGRGAMLSRQLPAELHAAIAALSKKTNATPFMIWMAIFHLLLHRYTHQEDIWVGAPIGNRQRPELQKMVGLFLNTIVIRSQIDPEQSFVDLLKQIQTKSLNAFANQDIPFDQVVNKIEPDRNAGLTPLFQTMLVYSPPPTAPKLHGMTFEKLDIKSEGAKLDLTLFVMGGDRPKASIQYSRDLFEPETIERMLGHLETLAVALTKDPTQTVSSYPLLTTAEEEQILVDWNASQPAPNISGRLLHGLVLKHGKTKGNHPAVIAGDTTLTYRELDLQSGNLARHLQSLGVNGESNPFVGLMVDRRPEMLIGILAILRAGGAYVPIDPDYPAERIEHIVNDAQLDIILTTGDYALPKQIDRPVNLINLSQPLPKQETADLAQIIQPTADSLAYLIYTSGSTGKPKGVKVTHANIVHSTTVRYAFYEHPAERFLLLSSFAFDSSMVGIFWTLCQGGTLILPEQGMHQNVGWLNKTIEAQSVTHLLALPSLYQILLEESSSQQLQSLNTVMVAGEACHAGLVEMHYARYPDSSLYNEYGPTEGTVWSHAYRFPKDFTGPAVPIGQAIPNVTQYIVDRNHQPVPIGVPGELILGGAGITPGYLNRDDLTAEKFITLPNLAKNETDRFYRTGDLVKWRADGNVMFLGRVDHQVKIRGFRVELGEIEAALTNQPAVKLAAVKAIQEEASGTKKLVAWFTADRELDDDDLRQSMGQSLPDYMVPAIFCQLDEMPQTPNGKVNRNALLVPVETVSAKTTADQVAAASETEQKLQSIWRSVLNNGEIGTTDNFFDLGGHSLLAIKLFARIEKEFDTVLPLATIFQKPTIQALAKKLDQDHAAVSLKEQLVVPIQPKGEKEPFFFIHDGAGYVFQYERLIETLGKERPIYGIIPPDWDGRKEIAWGLKEMVEQYAAVIQAVQPTGPYHLGGFSLGGVLAFEIGCHLQSKGEKVGVLGLIEPTPWNSELLVKGDTEGGSNLTRHLTNLKALVGSPLKFVDYIWQSTYGRGNQIFEAIRTPRLHSRIERSNGKVPRNLRDYYYLHIVSLRLMDGYNPSKLDADLHLFMMDRGPLIDPAIGWDTHNVQGRTFVHVQATNHHSKLIEEPFIDDIGSVLSKSLATGKELA